MVINITYLHILLINISFYVLVFILAKIVKKHSILDVFWGSSFVIQCMATLILTNNINYQTLITMLCVSLWGLRLTFHLARRNFSKDEDYRYIKIVEKLKKNFLFIPLIIKEYVYIYLLQVALSFIIAQAFILFILSNKEQNIVLFIVGLAVFIIGYLFEVIGDYQLKKYTYSPENPVLNTGLWKYTRHPNYFGEVVVWWGIFILTFSINSFYIAIISPLVITTLILKVSGVPMLEKELSKSESYQKYMQQTNKFFPGKQKEV